LYIPEPQIPHFGVFINVRFVLQYVFLRVFLWFGMHYDGQQAETCSIVY
jgi:hypothetical protein